MKLALATAAAVLVTVGAAQAQAMVLCTPFGCVRGPAPQLRLWPGEPLPRGYRGPPIAARPPPAMSSQPDRASSPAGSARAASRATSEENQIEDEILAFCRGHPEEGFCRKLGDYLARHPGRGPVR